MEAELKFLQTRLTETVAEPLEAPVRPASFYAMFKERVPQNRKVIEAFDDTSVWAILPPFYDVVREKPKDAQSDYRPTLFQHGLFEKAAAHKTMWGRYSRRHRQDVYLL